MDAQHVVNLSLKKILASRCRRGGIDLHRNLLIASVLLKARHACMARTYDHHGDQDDDESVTSVANADDVDSRREEKDDVTLTSDAVPNCDAASERECAESPQGVRWDAIPDQALEEWDFLGQDICSEQLEPEVDRKSDIKRPSMEGGSVGDDFPALDERTSGFSASTTSRKRTFELEASTEEASTPPQKRQKKDQTVNCESVCMDFDDLIKSMDDDDDDSANEEVLETSKDFVDKLSYSLEFPITRDSDIYSVSERIVLPSSQSSGGSFPISLNNVAISSAV